jgi:hypothetical protein
LTPAPASGAKEAPDAAEPAALLAPDAALAALVPVGLVAAALVVLLVVLLLLDEPPHAAVVSNAAPNATAAIGRHRRREEGNGRDMRTPSADRQSGYFA